MTLGFGVGLTGLRRWLYPDAKVEGRRSLIAGLLSPFVVFMAAGFSGGLTIVPFVAVLVLVGVIMALAMFFAWLSPTPDEMLGPEYGVDASEDPPKLRPRAS